MNRECFSEVLISESMAVARLSTIIKSSPQFTTEALTVLKKRYLWPGKESDKESTGEMFERVATHVAAAEKDHDMWAERYYGLMSGLQFLPNSPALMNAGREHGQLSACFVLPIDDSIDSIFSTLKSAALIQQSGGGTGFDF